MKRNNRMQVKSPVTLAFLIFCLSTGAFFLSLWGNPVLQSKGADETLAAIPKEDLKKPLVSCPDPDGENGYYRQIPKIQLTHYEKEAILKYQWRNQEGGSFEETLQFSGSEEEVTGEIPVEWFGQGENTLSVQLVSPDGEEWYAFDQTFWLDTVSPGVPVFTYQPAPRDNVIYANEPVACDLTSDDETSGVAKICYQRSDGISGVLEGGGGSLLLPVGFSGTVRAYAIDIAGNTSEERDSVLVVCEADLPLISIETPPDHQGWYSDAVTVTLSAMDPSGGSGIQSLLCVVNGQTLARQYCEQAGTEGCLMDQVKIEEAAVNGKGVTLTVAARDHAGNETIQTKEIRIDRTGPVIQAQNLHDKLITAQNVETDICLTDENLLSDGSLFIRRISPSGEEEKLVEEKTNLSGEAKKIWHTALKKEGIYQIRIEAEDMAGNHTQMEQRVTIDKTSPLIKYVEQMHGSYVPYFQWNYQAEEMISDFTDYRYQILLNGIPYQTGEKVIDEGPAFLQVKAEDAAGNRSTAEAIFTIDHTSPEILIYGVKNGEICQSDVELGVSVSGKGEWIREIKVNGDQMKLKKKSQLFQKKLIEDGAYTISIKAEDLAGNQSDKTISFQLKKTKNRRKGENGDGNPSGVRKGNRLIFVSLMVLALTLAVAIFWIYRKKRRP